MLKDCQPLFAVFQRSVQLNPARQRPDAAVSLEGRCCSTCDLDVVAMRAPVPFLVWMEAINQLERTVGQSMELHALAKHLNTHFKTAHQGSPDFREAMSFLQVVRGSSAVPFLTIDNCQVLLDMLCAAGQLRAEFDLKQKKHVLQLTDTSLAFGQLLRFYLQSPHRHLFFVHCPPRLLYQLCRVESTNWLEKIQSKWQTREEKEAEAQSLAQAAAGGDEEDEFGEAVAGAGAEEEEEGC